VDIWVANDILDWEINGGMSSSVSEKDWKRPYEIWEYAKNLITNNDDRENLAQGIIALKRSYNARHKVISNNYPFNNINFKSKVNKKKKLELLEQYGLIRASLINKLLEIRNPIEHNDSLPPTKEKCIELVDYVWYFLKSTDDLILRIPNEVEMKNEDDYFYKVNLNTEESAVQGAKVIFNFKGYLNINSISFTPKKNYMHLQNSRIISDIDELKKIENYEKTHLQYDPKGVFIYGDLLNADVQYSFLKKILNDPWR
jgi:hypothetical protein